MTTGDQNDCFWRLWRALPEGWFPPPAANADGTPVVNGVLPALLWGMAAVLAFCYALLTAVQAQTRIATASGPNLDIVAGDFFGLTLPRGAGETDSAYRQRIVAQLFMERGTRAALTALVTRLTPQAPVIVEPWRAADCGGFGVPACGYGAAGAWGSQLLPYTAFVQITRPVNQVFPGSPGYGGVQGGYGAACSWAPEADLAGADDALLYAAVNSVKPAGVEVWVRLVNG